MSNNPFNWNNGQPSIMRPSQRELASRRAAIQKRQREAAEVKGGLVEFDNQLKPIGFVPKKS